MTPEEEMAVIVPDAISYKGVMFDLPKPVADHIAALIQERHSARQSADALHERLKRAEGWPEPPAGPEWVRVDPWGT